MFCSLAATAAEVKNLEIGLFRKDDIRVNVTNWVYDDSNPFPPINRVKNSTFWSDPKYFGLREKLSHKLAEPVVELGADFVTVMAGVDATYVPFIEEPDSGVDDETAAEQVAAIASQKPEETKEGLVHILPLASGDRVPDVIDKLTYKLVIIECLEEDTTNVHTMALRAIQRGADALICGPTLEVDDVCKRMEQTLSHIHVNIYWMRLYRPIQATTNYKFTEFKLVMLKKEPLSHTVCDRSDCLTPFQKQTNTMYPGLTVSLSQHTFLFFV